jgi:alditol oxidase
VTTEPWKNWAGNVTFAAARTHRPTSVAELQQLVAGSSSIRALGTGHSFNRIADTTGDLVSVAALPTVIEIDSERSLVSVSGGTRYGELGRALQDSGFALHNTGSLPHISVAGACATGTHGSGNTNGNLSSIVSAIEFVTAGGDVVAVSREAHGDEFNGMVLALGSLGILTQLELGIVPTFDIRQDVYDNLPRARFDAHFDEIVAGGYSVSVFSDWKPAGMHQVWRKNRVDAGRSGPPDSSWLDAALATTPRHPVPGMPAEFTTAQLGVAGPWNERLPHFRLDFTPSNGDELQSEYLLPREHAVQARAALDDVAGDIAAVLQISEFRTVAADDLWISPSYHTDSVAFHFTWIPDEAAVSPVLTAIQERLADFDARPHWGKVFTTSSQELARLYERLPDFRALLRAYDPAEKFRNDLVERLVMNGE